MMILTATFLLVLVGWVLGRGRTVGLAGLVIIFLASWPPVGWLVQRSLEFPYRPQMPPSEQASGAIVVLGGYMSRNDWGGPALLGTDTYERLAYAAALHRHWPEVPIVVSGGPLLGPDYPPLAEIMAAHLRQIGVPPERIVVEPRAGNTYDNARYCAPLLPREAQVTLITHGTHMRRAQSVFEAQGMRVVPAPCCFDSTIDQPDASVLMPNWWTIRSVEGALHEWLGLAVYKLRGWI